MKLEGFFACSSTRNKLSIPSEASVACSSQLVFLLQYVADAKYSFSTQLPKTQLLELQCQHHSRARVYSPHTRNELGEKTKVGAHKKRAPRHVNVAA